MTQFKPNFEGNWQNQKPSPLKNLVHDWGAAFFAASLVATAILGPIVQTNVAPSTAPACKDMENSDWVRAFRADIQHVGFKSQCTPK